MNSSTNGTRYYAEDFEGEVVVPRFVWITLAILAVAATCVASMAFGAWVERQITPSPDVKILTLAGPRPLSQWQCTKQEFAEYREACLRRSASALIKPKE